MRYSLIGCGRISTNHIKAAKANGLEICSVCDLIPSKMEAVLADNELNNDSSIHRYTDYRQMLETEKPELVSIATESGKHAEIALYCIEHGFNTIIEKPMAMSLKDADRIIEAADKAKVVVSVCQQCRFNKAVMATRKALEEGRFGKLSHASINVYWFRDKAYYDHDAWRGTWKDDGGCLMNQCIHGADLLRWMMGTDIDYVYGVTRNHLHTYLETEDVGNAIVQFSNGTIGVIEGSGNVFRKNMEETLHIFGEKGKVKLGGNSVNNVEVWDFSDEKPEDEEIKTLTEPAPNVYGHGHMRLFADVIDAIENHREPYVKAKDGRTALELILAIYKSQKTGMPVKLPLTDFSTEDMNGTFGTKDYVAVKTTEETNSDIFGR